MANRKLLWWSEITGRAHCAHCGELWATTTTLIEGHTIPACKFCAAWVNAGCPEHEEPHITAAYAAACGQLPWPLRRRTGGDR